MELTIEGRTDQILGAIDSWCNYKDNDDITVTRVRTAVEGMIDLMDEIFELNNLDTLSKEECDEICIYMNKRVETERNNRAEREASK